MIKTTKSCHAFIQINIATAASPTINNYTITSCTNISVYYMFGKDCDQIIPQYKQWHFFED